MNIIIKEKADAMLNAKLEGNQFLRVGVAEGGCAGLTYSAEIDSKMMYGEAVIFSKGDIKVVADIQASEFMNGLVIDYSDDLINGGLQFTNTHTKGTCGCGQSFSLAGFPQVEGGQCRH